MIQPPSTLLIGPAGSGKTSAIATQLLCGLEVFVIITEPDGVASLLDACARLNAPVDNLHWCVCAPAAAGWMELEDMITKISSMDQKQLADQRDMGKASFRPAALKFLNAFRSFGCERTGQDFGDFSKWGPMFSLNVDSLTGWNMIAWGCTVGFKPTANPGEWGIAQNFIFNMLNKINADRKCFFTLTAHMEKEMDEMTGVRRVMVSTIGAKLAPKIPPFFSEVVRCERIMSAGTAQAAPSARFTWSTIDTQMDLKNRALPISNNLPADFEPIVDAYLRRVQLAGGSQQSPPPQTAKAPQPNVVPPAAPMSPPKATQTGEWK